MSIPFSFHPRGLAPALGAAALLLGACQTTGPASATAVPVKPAPTAQGATAPSPAGSPVVTPAASPAASPVASKPSASPAAPASLDERAVADFYRGKTVRLVVGFGPGGGYDTYARLVGRYLGKYIPGNPTVIVENMPGAGSKLSYSQVANALPKDGTVLGIGDGGMAETQLLRPADFDFDFAQLQYVGAPSVFEYILFITKAASDRSGVKKFEDTLGPSGKEVILGVTGTGLDFVTQQLLREVLGVNVRSVSGYAGSAAIRLAMENGEVDGYTNGWDSISATNNADVMNGNWVLLLQMTEKPIAALPASLPKMPIWLDFAKNEEDKQLLRQGGVKPQLIGRGYYMAPGVPADRLAAIRSAFTRTMSDPDLLGEAKKANLEINPLTGDQLQAAVAEFMTMPEPMKDRLRKILNL